MTAESRPAAAEAITVSATARRLATTIVARHQARCMDPDGDDDAGRRSFITWSTLQCSAARHSPPPSPSSTDMPPAMPLDDREVRLLTRLAGDLVQAWLHPGPPPGGESADVHVSRQHWDAALQAMQHEAGAENPLRRAQMRECCYRSIGLPAAAAHFRQEALLIEQAIDAKEQPSTVMPTAIDAITGRPEWGAVYGATLPNTMRLVYEGRDATASGLAKRLDLEVDAVESMRRRIDADIAFMRSEPAAWAFRTLARVIKQAGTERYFGRKAIEDLERQLAAAKGDLERLLAVAKRETLTAAAELEIPVSRVDPVVDMLAALRFERTGHAHMRMQCLKHQAWVDSAKAELRKRAGIIEKHRSTQLEVDAELDALVAAMLAVVDLLPSDHVTEQDALRDAIRDRAARMRAELAKPADPASPIHWQEHSMRRSSD